MNLLQTPEEYAKTLHEQGFTYDMSEMIRYEMKKLIGITSTYINLTMVELKKIS